MIAAAVLCATVVPSSGPNLVITDEPDPLGAIVFVPIHNVSEDTCTGLLTVEVVYVDQTTGTVTRQVTVDGMAQINKAVLFSAVVSEVISAGIVE